MVDLADAPGTGPLREFASGVLLAEGVEPGEANRVSERLVAYARLLADWGSRLNLTGSRGAEAILAELVVDSALLGLALPAFVSLVDIGSGGGLPGIPLALLFPERRFLLIEPRERRHHFLRHAIRVLRADNVRTLRARADEQTPELHDIAVAQAVGPPDSVVPMLLRWVRPGGWIAIPTVAEGCRTATLVADLDSRLEPYGTGRPRPHALWLARVPDSPQLREDQADSPGSAGGA